MSLKPLDIALFLRFIALVLSLTYDAYYTAFNRETCEEISFEYSIEQCIERHCKNYSDEKKVQILYNLVESRESKIPISRK